MTCFVEKAILAQVIISDVMKNQETEGIKAIECRSCEISRGTSAYIVHNYLLRKT